MRFSMDITNVWETAVAIHKLVKDIKIIPPTIIGLRGDISRSISFLEDAKKLSEEDPNPYPGTAAQLAKTLCSDYKEDFENVQKKLEKHDTSSPRGLFYYVRNKSEINASCKRIQRFNTQMVYLKSKEEEERKARIKWSELEILKIPDEIKDEQEMTRKDERNAFKNSPPKWICQTPKFKNWYTPSQENAPSEQPRWLWLLASAGVGKTCVATFIADYLQGEQRDAGVAVFFCKHTRSGLHRSDLVLKSLIRQLMEQLDQRSGNAELSTERQKNLKQLKDSGNRIDFLTWIASQFHRIYIIIDGLDEYSDSENERICLIDDLNTACSSSVGLLRFFVTSRPRLPETISERGTLIIDKFNNSEAMRAYILDELTNIQAQRSSFQARELTPFLQVEGKFNTVLQKVHDDAHESFYSAKLQIKALRQAHDDVELREMLLNLTGKVDELIEKAIARITTTAGKRALMWAIFGFRSLTAEELTHAIMISQNSKEKFAVHLGKIKLFHKQRLVDETAYLLEFDHDAKRIMVNRPIREYFRTSSQAIDGFADASIHIADCCLVCLTPNYCDISEAESLEFEPGNEYFFRYAKENWGRHVLTVFKELRDSSEIVKRLHKQILDLLNMPHFVIVCNYGIAVNRDRILMSPGLQTCVKFFESTQKPCFLDLHLLIYFGLQDTISQWIEAGGDLNLPFRRGDRPSSIEFACQQGQSRIASMLVSKGADIKNCRLGLHEAASQGLVEVVGEILNRFPEIVGDLEAHHPSYLSSAITSAHENYCETIVENILKAAASQQVGFESLMSKDLNGPSPLHQAALRNYSGVIKLLVTASKDSNYDLLDREWKERFQDTALHVACHEGMFEAATVLINLNANANSRQLQQKTPLHIAIQEQQQRGRDGVKLIELLITKTEHGLVDMDGNNFAHTAAEHGSLESLVALKQKLSRETIKELLRQTNKSGKTPLVVARHSKHGRWKQCFNWCLKHMAGYISSDDATIALETIEEYPWDFEISARMLQMLHDVNFSPTRAGEPQTPILLRYAKIGSLELFESACQDLEGGSCSLLDVQDGKTGRTALMEAITWRYLAEQGPDRLQDRWLDIVKFLLYQNCNVTLRDSDGKTALHYAVERHMLDIVRLLQERREIVVDVKDKSGYTPLQRCSSQNTCHGLLTSIPPDNEFDREYVSKSPDDQNWMVTVGHWSDAKVFTDAPNLVPFHISGDTTWYSAGISKPVEHRSAILRSEPIPLDIKLPISRIRIAIEGRDQGHTVTSIGSTSYKLAILRNGIEIYTADFAQVKYPCKTLHTHDRSWHLKDNRIEVHDSEIETQLERNQQWLVGKLQIGDQIAIIAEASGLGRMNITKRAQITIYYKHETPEPRRA